MRGNDHLLVEKADNGSQGIAEDIKLYIFKPFFTTKDLGVTETHRGDTRIYSRPGETRFQACLSLIYNGKLEQRYWSWVKPLDNQGKL